MTTFDLSSLVDLLPATNYLLPPLCLKTMSTALLFVMFTVVLGLPSMSVSAVGSTSEDCTSSSSCCCEGTAGEPIARHAFAGFACCLSMRYSVAEVGPVWPAS